MLNTWMISENGITRSIVIIGMIAAISASGCKRASPLSDKDYVDHARTYLQQSKVEEARIELKNAIQQNPKNAEAQRLLGELYVMQGYAKEGEKALARAMELGVDDDNAKITLGRALIMQGQFKRVIADIQKSSKATAADGARILALHAEALLGLNRVDDGCATYGDAANLDPKLVEAYLGKARCVYIYGKPGDARAEVERALKVSPQSSDAWRWIGDLDQAAKKLAEAEAAYGKALDANPRDLLALFGRAGVRAQQNNLIGAKGDIGAALKINANHPHALYLQGVLQYREHKLQDAKNTFETVLRNSPSYAPAILWLGLTNFALNNLEQASQRLGQYLKIDPGNSKVRALLGLTQARLGNKQEASETLKPLSNVDVSDPQSLAVLGQAHLLLGEAERSARYLTSAVEKDPEATDPRIQLAAALLKKGDDEPAIEQLESVLRKEPGEHRAEMMLLGAWLRDKEYGKALKYIDELEAKNPSLATAHTYRAQVHILQKDLSGARKELETALQKSPGDSTAGGMLAAIAVQEKKPDEARKIFESVLKRNPNHLDTMMAMAQMEIRLNRLDEAKAILERAATVHSKAPAPAKMLASGYLLARDPGKALEVTTEAIKANPDDIDLLQVRGAAQLLSGDPTAGISTFSRIVKLRPELAEAHFKLALAHTANRDSAQARKALGEVLVRDRNHFTAKVMLAQLDLKEQHPESAVRLGRELQQNFPGAVEGYIIEAEALSAQQRATEAIKVLERASKGNPDATAVPIEMFRVQWSAGERDRAIATLSDWYRSHPKDGDVAMLLGERLIDTGREKEAVEIYRALAKNQPGNIAALNNLAVSLQKSDPASALEYAQQAHRAAPANPGVLDTLGWILIQQGNLDRGLVLLGKAYELAPNVGEIHYHFAAALARTGAKDKARRELEKLLASGKPFKELNAAKDLLANM
jgi:putative PEP-CTERM system TPR-repeat lipoprotein